MKAFAAGAGALALALSGAPAAAAADGCGHGAPERSYDVSAINVDIPLNRFGDYDADGMMYVLDADIGAARAQSRSKKVSIGLGDDAIQPLVLRGNVGECLVVRFTNRLRSSRSEVAPRVSLRAVGLEYTAARSGDGVGLNDGADTSPRGGQSATYRFFLDPRAGEAVHAFHSGGDARELTGHGLFGAIVAEPAGSQYLDPKTGKAGLRRGWQAIIKPPRSRAFREFALLYHEVGDESFVLSNANNDRLPMNDSSNPANQQLANGPASGAYRPGTRAINYRSEPFMRRMELESAVPLPAGPRLGGDGHPLDKSGLYSTYSFGDPATPIARSYVGEPTKTRLVNAGAEMAHVHHLHGGGTRWRRNPAADDTDIEGGLEKKPIQDAKSIRLDSQTVSPGESFTLEHECGAGGCQQAAGDFLYHCHIAQHYVAGMWAMWRVFDTRQADLAPVPGTAAPPKAVTSAGLLGRRIEGRKIVREAQLRDPAHERSLESLVESQLPPRGVRAAWDDASVWDWDKRGDVYLGEPDDTRTWENYASPTPGERPEIRFNPRNGRPAWPLLRPHLATRPTFAPGAHSPAPWLGETGSRARRDGICPPGAPARRYDVTAITLPIKETPTTTDPDGEVYVLNQDKADVLAGRRAAQPLVFRANVGDCVDLTLSSELLDNAESHDYSKVNIHTHLVQFDPQGSDGVVTGGSFEQSVRPAAIENRTLSKAATAGDGTIAVTRTSGLRTGVAIAIGQGDPDIEVRSVRAIAGGTLTLDAPLARDHGAGERTGVEFARYRWYADVDTGSVFWHDHVDGINTWDHGLFGALVVEPKGSTYHDPQTGEQVRSGPLADVRTAGSVGAGQKGPFREFVCILHDGLRNDPNAGTLANGQIFRQGGSINLRAAPLSERGPAGDPDRFSSVKHGDPPTPLPRAYAGDPLVVRTLGVTELQGALRITGHRFRSERFSQTSARVDTATTGLSERFDYVLDGGAAKKAGDYLYYSAAQGALSAGAWGLLRVHDRREPDLQPLPGRAPPDGAGFPHLPRTGGVAPAAAGPGEPCPPTAPRRSYELSIFAKPLPLSTHPQAFQVIFVPGVPGVPVPAAPGKTQDADGVIYALTKDRAAILAGTKPLEPLVIRASAGDCVELVLHNELSARAGLSLGKLPYDPQGSAGAPIGYDPDSSVPPGGQRRYRFHADAELGTSILLDPTSPERQAHGAFGALIVEPAGATWADPKTGGALESGVQAAVAAPGGAFREFVALLHEDEQNIGKNDGRYWTEVAGFAGLNYHAAPFADRLQGPLSTALETAGLNTTIGGRLPDPRLTTSPPAVDRKADRSLVFSSKVYGDPPTTLMRAYAGEPVRFRAAAPSAGQWHVFALDGHRWASDPGLPGSSIVGAEMLGPSEEIDVATNAGAAGDYLYRDHRYPFTQAGLWGLMRVFDAPRSDLVALPGSR